MKKRIMAFLCILALSVGSIVPDDTAYAANGMGELYQGSGDGGSRESGVGQAQTGVDETMVPEEAQADEATGSEEGQEDEAEVWAEEQGSLADGMSAEAVSEAENPESVQPSGDMEDNTISEITEGQAPEGAEGLFIPEAPQEAQSQEAGQEAEANGIAESPEAMLPQPEADSTELEKTDTVKNADFGLGREMSIEGENGFGSLMAAAFMEEVTEQQENNGYNIFAIEVTGNVAEVSFESLGYASLVVGIYDEAGGQMLASGTTQVSPEETAAVVEIETESMPQYFYVRGFLVEAATYRPLSTVYESPMYTKEMQDFLAKTTADFDADRVLNLDEDITNNFAVFREGIILIPENSGYNEVVTADESSNTYVIANADENIAGLQPGDIFSYHYGENDVLIVKVASINLDGTTATILGDETSLEEVFDYVKIDAQGGSADAVVDTSTCAEGVTYEGLVEYAEEGDLQTYSVETGGSASKAFKQSFDKEFERIEDMSVKLSGELEMKLTFSAKLYFSLDTQYVELKLDYGAKISASVTGKAKADIPLITVGFMFAGVIVELTPSVVLDTTGSITLEGALSGTIGFQAQVGKGMKNLTTVPRFKPSFKVEGSIFFGLSLEPRVKILSEKVASASLGGQVGVEISASVKDPFQSEEDRIHTCAACISGEVNGKFSLTAEVEFVNKWKYNLTMLDVKIKILDFYYSGDRDEFGLTTCPYYLYRIKLGVLDSLQKPIEGVAVKGAALDGEYVTDQEGKTEFWLPAGTYAMYFQKEGYQLYALTVIVSDSGQDLHICLQKKDGQGSGSGSEDGGGDGGDGNGGDNGDGGDIGERKGAQVSLGGSHSAAMTREGDLYLWGYNKCGQLGNGTTEDSNVPIKIMSNVKEVSLGSLHSAAITEEGDLYLWGYNEYGQLGNRANADSNSPIKIMGNVKKVSLGGRHSAAITEESDLYLWGNNDFGLIGNGTNDKNYKVPIKIMSNVKEVSLGYYHSAAITKEGDLYLWGYNAYGGLGNGTNKNSSNIPIKIMGNAKEISLSTFHSAVVTDKEDLYLWGHNYNGQLGSGTTEDSKVPIKIMDNVKEVSLGGSHSAAITEEGDLYLWGANWYGQLGNGTTKSSKVPIKIMGNMNGNSMGGRQSTVIAEEGDLYLQALSIQTESLSEENRERITQNADTAEPELSAGFSGRQQNWNGSYFTDLLPNETYNYYAVKSKTADQPFASGNLLYIGQAVSDGSGTLNVAFAMQEAYADAEIFAVPMRLTDISGADVAVDDLTYNGELQYAPVIVTCQGIRLAAGEDYYVEGDYGVTEQGDYILTINGTGLYKGTITVAYKVLPVSAQYQISGTVKSYGKTQDDAVVRLLQGADEVSSTRTVNGMYQLDEVPGGLYILEVSRANHATRRYEITVSDKAVVQDAEIWLIGDVNGDGKVNAKDKKILYNHIAGNSPLAEYAFLAGDVNGDGRVNAKDKKMVYNHIAGSALLW